LWCHFVVATDFDLFTQLSQILHQVVGERIVVVENEDHAGCADSLSQPLAIGTWRGWLLPILCQGENRSGARSAPRCEVPTMSYGQSYRPKWLLTPWLPPAPLRGDPPGCWTAGGLAVNPRTGPTGGVTRGFITTTGGRTVGPNRWTTGGPTKNTGARNTSGGEKNPKPNGLKKIPSAGMKV